MCQPLSKPKLEYLSKERWLEILKESGDKSLSLSFRKDFRRRIVSRKKPTRIKPGFSIRKVPDGYEMVRSDVRAANNLSFKVTKLKPKFRDVKISGSLNRKWTRHNPNFSRDLEVNDLLYYRRLVIDGTHTLSLIKNYGDPVNTQYVSYAGHSSVCPLYGLIDEVVPSKAPYFSDEAGLEASCLDLIESARFIAHTRLRSKIKSQEVDLGTELSQASQTVGLIRDLYKRLYSLTRDVKNGNVLKAVKQFLPSSVKGIANDRLVYVYGIKPLISDIEGLKTALLGFLENRVVFKCNGHATKQSVQAIPWSNSCGGLPYCEGSIVITTIVRVKEGCSYRVSDRITRIASQLGFTNPANTVWELLPFSFVFDWAYPIGNWLNSLDSLFGIEVNESYETVFITRHTQFIGYQAHSLPVTSGDLVVDYGGSYDWSIFETFCRRTKQPLQDVPLPRFKNPFKSVDHLFNSAALFFQRFNTR